MASGRFEWLGLLAFIAAFDDACHVRHATVTELDVKFVANLVESVVRGKVFVNNIEGLFADIRFNFHVVREIEPGDVFSLVLVNWLNRGMHGYAMHDGYPAIIEALAYGGIALSNDLRSYDS